MKLAVIFQDLEHLYDFQTIGYGGDFVFKNEVKILHRHVSIAINMPCKFDKWTYGGRFIVSRPRPSATSGK